MEKTVEMSDFLRSIITAGKIIFILPRIGKIIFILLRIVWRGGLQTSLRKSALGQIYRQRFLNSFLVEFLCYTT